MRYTASPRRGRAEGEGGGGVKGGRNLASNTSRGGEEIRGGGGRKKKSADGTEKISSCFVPAAVARGCRAEF